MVCSWFVVPSSLGEALTEDVVLSPPPGSSYKEHALPDMDMPPDYNWQPAPQGYEDAPAPAGASYQPQPPPYSVQGPPGSDSVPGSPRAYDETQSAPQVESIWQPGDIGSKLASLK